MGIFQRISDIVSANLNDMMENYEDPEQMLRQAVREMEQAISKARPEVASAIANEKTVKKELDENEKQRATWAERAATAVADKNDDLARRCLTRKNECEKVAAALRDQHEAASEASQTLRRQLEAMQAKLSDAQRRLGTLSARKKVADIRSKVAKADLGVELDQDAFAKFDRLSQKVERAEAEAEAMAELAKSHPAGTTPDEPNEQKAGDWEIEAELAELKKKSKDNPEPANHT